MGRVQAAQRIDARQQFGGHAVHHLADLAVHVGMQAAEVGDAGRRAHAAEKAVALHQQGAAAGLRGGGRGGHAGRAAAEHDHVVLAVNLASGELGSVRLRGMGSCVEIGFKEPGRRSGIQANC